VNSPELYPTLALVPEDPQLSLSAPPAYDSTTLAIPLATLNESEKNLEPDVAGGAVRRTVEGPPQYLFEELIATGGFGEIWQAKQGSLGRTVAIKRLRRDLLKLSDGDGSALRRYEQAFRQEAVIAAQLEHPNVVPIHEMGTEADGLPLLVMKLVRGRAWSRIISEDFDLPIRLFLHKHLNILIGVAQAIAFAHSRGIVHRDIKPSQVMVGEFGEVQVMDWGIALRLDDIERVRSGQLPSGMLPNPSGTPAFMAPEQTEKTVMNIGTWTDVYLLGGTLYFILTGCVPHPGSTTIVALAQACSGEIVAPTKCQPYRDIPEELGELAMWAMAPSAKGRTPSVEVFLRRLQDFITGESRRVESEQLCNDTSLSLDFKPKDYPTLDACNSHLDRALMLWPENPRIAALRDRTRLLYAESAVAGGDLRLARMHAAQLLPSAQRDKLEASLRIAEERQAQADQRLQQAMRGTQDLLDFVILDLHGGLRDIGRLDLLEKAASKVFEHFAHFPEIVSDASVAAHRNRTQALRNIADVFKEKGRLSDALAALREAVRIADEWIAAEATGEARGSAGWKEDLSDTWDKIGMLYYELGDLETALDYTLRGMEARFELTELEPARLEWASRLAWSFNRKGQIHWRQGEQRQALVDFDEAISLRQAILLGHPGNPSELAALAFTHNGRTWVYRALGQGDEALEDALKALEMRREIHALRPHSLAALGDLAWSLKSIGLLHQDRLEVAKAISAFQEAQVICRRLSDGDPSNTARRMELAFCHGGLGLGRHLLGELPAAEREYRLAIELHGPIVEQENSHGFDLRDHLYNLAGLTAVLLEMERTEDARAVAERSLHWGNQLRQRTHSNPSFAEAYARTLLQAGRLRAAAGNRDEARRLWEEAADVMTPFFVKGDHPTALEETLTVTLWLLDRREDAAVWLERLKRKNSARSAFLRIAAGVEIA